MKILQICGAQHAGGAEAHFLRFCIELNKHEGMDVVAIVRKDSWLEEQLNKEDITVYTLGFRSSFDLITSIKILKISLKEKSDIIQCWMNRAATLTPKRARGFKIGRLGGYYSLKNYKSMDWLVGATDDICNHITQNGWRSDKLSCIPNFVNLPKSEDKQISSNLKDELGLNGKIILFTPARLHDVKGLDTGIEALKLLPGHFCYLIVGSGPEEDNLKKLADSLGVRDRVFFAGWQNDITPFCYISDIFLVPSRHEPFGSVLLEAWSHKKPLVTSDSQGALAITEDNKTSLIFNKDNPNSLAEKVSILQSNVSLKSRIVENGYNELISKYVARSVLNTYTSLYKKTLESNNMKKLPISVIFITKNETDRIEKAINSVADWVDEIIVVDSGSTDDTVQKAERLDAKIFYNEWPGYGQQKRFAEEKASHEWILNLDADERVTVELKNEILALFKKPEQLADGYHIAIHDIIYLSNKLNPKTPYKPIRLYKKSKGRYSESPVHDRVIMQDDTITDKLNGKIAHASIRDFSHRVEKMNSYSSAQVEDMINKGRKPSKIRIVLEFWLSFLKRYFLKGYWRQGLIGYIYAMNYAYSRFLRQIKLYEHYKKNYK